jgi:hypothetical protein
VAILATEVRRHSHAQHFLDRFVEGYGWQGRHHRPPFAVSLFVDQFPDGDLARDRVRRFKLPLHATVAEALTWGGSKLAVDGVLIIGEHGSYPSNAKGQRLYPRYKWFREVAQVFEASGRSCPVFNDKHLSTRWEECQEMVETSRRLGFAFLAGSSLPVTWRIPPLDLPSGSEVEECVCAAYGGVDSYDFHALETAQCMVERRAGGEMGVQSLHAMRGAKVWDFLRGRPRTQSLLLSALARSHTLRPSDGFTTAAPSLEHAAAKAPDAVAYVSTHRDGLENTMLLLNGLVSDFNVAVRLKGSGRVVSTQMYLPMPGSVVTTANFFNPLVHHVEDMVHSGKAAYPVERTLLTSGQVIFGVESLYRGEVPLLTPELAVTYSAPAESSFWRA